MEGVEDESTEDREEVGVKFSVVFISQLHFGHNADVKDPLILFLAFDHEFVKPEKTLPFDSFILY